MCVNSRDTCTCRPCCTYPNGFIVLLLAQVLMFCAFLMSLFAVGDCQFVTVPATESVDDSLTAIFNDTDVKVDDNDTERGLGFFFWEDVDGECAWDREHTEDSFEAYWDFVGRSDWESAASAAFSACVLSFCFFVWLLTFSCLAQPKIVRYSCAGLLIVLLTVLQSVPFRLLNSSEFCDEHDCSLGRSAHYSIAAVVLYFVAGVLLLFTRDYPGPGGAGSSAQVFVPATTAPEEQQPKNGTIDENATVEHTLDEETLNQFTDRATLPEAVPVQDDMMDVSLVDSSAPTEKTGNKARLY